MKKILKNFIIFFVVLHCIFVLPAYADSTFFELRNSNAALAAMNDSTRASDEYIWYYKETNGKLYKRLYNKSSQEWETDWIFIKNL